MPHAGEQQEHLTTGELQDAWDIHSLAAAAVNKLEVMSVQVVVFGPLNICCIRKDAASLCRGVFFFYFISFFCRCETDKSRAASLEAAAMCDFYFAGCSSSWGGKGGPIPQPW